MRSIKKCGRCGIEKEFKEFPRKTDVSLQSYCFPCNREQKKEWYNNNKNHVIKEAKKRKVRNQEFLIGYLLNHPCVDCGETDIVVLEFDHLRDKKRNVTDMAHRGYSVDLIIDEIDKCEVVCANDHKRRTASRANWLKFRGIGGRVNTSDFQSED